MTRAQIRTLVQQHVGNRVTGVFNNAWFDARVLDAYRRLVSLQGRTPGSDRGGARYRHLRFPEMENRLTRSITLSEADNFLANQSGAFITIDIYDRTNDRGLSLVSEADLRYHDPDDLGVPREWRPGALNGINGYWIWPRPGTTSDNIDVYETVLVTPTLAADGDSPLVAEHWHRAIEYAAASDAAMLMDIPEKHDALEQKFAAYVSERLSYNEMAIRGSRSGRRRRIQVAG